MYNWYAVKTGKLCPAGWQVPCHYDWSVLSGYLKGEFVAGGKMKSVTGWSSPNTGATNESGFSGLAGGIRSTPSYYVVGSYGYWWSSSEYSTAYAYYRKILNNVATLFDNYGPKYYGISVRCVRDN
jgi:uncharacterized protein (TIGR02145 family)